jgi:hypothetical protein
MSRKIWEVSQYSHEIDTNAEKILDILKIPCYSEIQKKKSFRVQEYFKIFLEAKIWMVGPLSESKFRVAAFLFSKERPWREFPERY